MKNHHKSGYLLIELLIAILVLCAMGYSIAMLSRHISEQNRDAIFYLKAVNIAQRIIRGDDPILIHEPLFTITKRESHPIDTLPYTAVTVTLKMEGKTITFHGGRAEYHA